jgi:hypothetical protein
MCLLTREREKQEIAKVFRKNNSIDKERFLQRSS